MKVKGYVNIKGTKKPFEIEIDAKSKKHAEELIYSHFGAKNGLKRNAVSIESIE